MLFVDPPIIFSAALIALLLDFAFGEWPPRWHPLVYFGRLAGAIEARGLRDNRWRGAACWCLAVLPATALTAVLNPHLGLVGQAFALYIGLAYRSLRDHSTAVHRALESGDLARARANLGLIVSRDTAHLDRRGISAAAVESTLENSSDGVFAAYFWFLWLGAPGAIGYRLCNTLDAMWGYRTPRYARFGFWAAKVDDVLNYLPARLTALSFCLVGRHRRRAWNSWQGQAARLVSPNGGPVMASGGGSLDTQLGGDSRYHGHWQPKPRFGGRRPATPEAILAALGLVQKTLLIWVLATGLGLLEAYHGF